MTANHVEYDVLGDGPEVSKSGGSNLDGTLIALGRRINDSTGHVEGSLVSSKEIIITSGAKVECFCGTCSGGANNGQVCMTNDDCPNGTCQPTTPPG